MGTGEKRGKQLQSWGSAGTCAKVNSIIIMAEIFNNRICVFANELIIFNPKTQVGSEDGFIPERNILFDGEERATYRTPSWYSRMSCPSRF